MIRESADEQIVARIPAGMLSVSYKGRNKSEAAISSLASRIYFFSEREIRLVTKEGLDCILDYETRNLVSATAVDNLDLDDFEHPHFYLEKKPHSTNDTMARLQQTSSAMKSMRAYLRKQLKHQGATDAEATEGMKKPSAEQLFSVDYS